MEKYRSQHSQKQSRVEFGGPGFSLSTSST